MVSVAPSSIASKLLGPLWACPRGPNGVAERVSETLRPTAFSAARCTIAGVGGGSELGCGSGAGTGDAVGVARSAPCAAALAGVPAFAFTSEPAFALAEDGELRCCLCDGGLVPTAR